MRHLPIALFFIVLTIVGCGANYRAVEVASIIEDAEEAALRHESNGDLPEAALLCSLILEIDPDREEASRIYSENQKAVPNKGWLGANVSLRPNGKRSVWKKVLLYLPDRVLDLLDVISLDLHLGPGLYTDVYVTRALQSTIGARAISGIGWNEDRSLGVRTSAETGVNVLPIGAWTMAGTRAGTGGVQIGKYGVAGIHNPMDEVYQEFTDYYAIGSSVTLIFFGVEANVHPIQIPDFIVGIFFIDFLRDDFAHTRSLRFSRTEKQRISELLRINRSKSSVNEYQNSDYAMKNAAKDSPEPAEESESQESSTTNNATENDQPTEDNATE